MGGGESIHFSHAHISKNLAAARWEHKIFTTHVVGSHHAHALTYYVIRYIVSNTICFEINTYHRILYPVGAVGGVAGVPRLPDGRGLPLGRDLRVRGLPHARGARPGPAQREQVPHTEVPIRLHRLLPLAGA